MFSVEPCHTPLTQTTTLPPRSLPALSSDRRKNLKSDEAKTKKAFGSNSFSNVSKMKNAEQWKLYPLPRKTTFFFYHRETACLYYIYYYIAEAMQ